jgi:hypothetical protein
MGDKSPKQKTKNARQKQDVKDQKQRKLDAATSARAAAGAKTGK